MTTAAVVAYYSQDNAARVSYAGHPPVLYKRVTDKVWSFARLPGHKNTEDSRPMNIPLAVAPDTLYGQLTIPMAAGDRLFIYSDGIIDVPNAEGESFGLTRLKGVLDKNTKTSLSELKFAVLEALHQYRKEELTHDDVTMIALEIC